ncbi:MAG: FHA domain-containing protein [Acidobacteria bacterium]|nr:FHA domain-containing protein [Acidobacteriota bacterium]
MSRYHAQLHYDTSSPVITDLGSSNGTFINGDVLRGGYMLQPSDWVTIGGYLVQVNGREVQKKDLSASRIVAYNVSKSYGEKTVVNGVSVALIRENLSG